MASSEKAAPVAHYRRPRWKRTFQLWPLLIFVSVALLAIVLYSKGGKYRVMSGTAERLVENVAPLEAARVASIEVEVGDRVMAGDVIAQLDTSIIDAEAAVQKERIIQTRLDAQLNQLTLERQFSGALQEAEQELREAEMELRLNAVELEALSEEISRLEPLFQQKLISAESYYAKKARESVLRETVEMMPDHIKALTEDVERARKQKASAMARLEEMRGSSAISGETRTEALTLLNIRREGYTLRAQQDGVVAQIDRQPGDVVEAGGSIASVLIHGPARVVGFLPESDLSSIAIGTPANVYPTVSLRNSGVIAARVSQIDPAVYSLPERASPIRGQVVRGRRVTLELLDPAANLIPGESVSIEIESSLFQPVSLED